MLGRYQGVVGLRSPAASLIALKGVVTTTLVVGFSLTGTLTYLWLFKSYAGDSPFQISDSIPYSFRASQLINSEPVDFGLEQD